MLVPLIFEAVRTGHIHLIINFQSRRNAISSHIPNFRSKPIQFLTLIKIPSNKIHAERKGLVVTIRLYSEKISPTTFEMHSKFHLGYANTISDRN